MYLKHTLNIVIAGSESSVAFVISYEVITRTYRVLKRHMNNQTVPDFLPQQKSKLRFISIHDCLCYDFFPMNIMFTTLLRLGFVNELQTLIGLVGGY